MFYLKHFLFCLKSHIISFSLFIILTVVMLFAAMFDRPVRNWASANLIKQKKLSHFSILLANIPNLESYQRQMVKLPGVDSIEVVDKNVLKQHIERSLAELGELAPENFLTTNYTGLKIYLTEGISGKSYDLIREYAARIAGDNKVDMSSVIHANENSKRLWDDRHLMAFLMVLLFAGWSVSLMVISPKLSQMSYLIEHYQRRKKVHFKTLMTVTMTAFVFSLFTAIVIDFKTVNYALVSAFAIGLFCTFIVLIPKSRWR